MSQRQILAFSAAQVCYLTGLTPRQVSYWDRTGFFSPAYAQQVWHSAYARVYSFRDMVGLRAIAQMRKEHGVPLQHLRRVGAHVSEPYDQPWSSPTFSIVGRKVFYQEDHDQAIRSADRSGQAVLSFRMERVASEVKTAASELQCRPRRDIGKVTRNRYVAENQTVLAGTRVPTRAIWEFHQAGHCEADILREYPHLTQRDVRIAIQFERRRHFLPSTADQVIATAASEQHALVVTWNRRHFWALQGPGQATGYSGRAQLSWHERPGLPLSPHPGPRSP